MNIAKNILIISLVTISINLSAQEDYIYAPFGYKSRQPPTSGAIQLLDIQMGIKAQQVCGYTDWTTAQLKLPKQLLSKTYWKNIGKNLERQAIKSVMDISGALPSMLACNASATFCQVMNQSELMAGFESNLTWNTCNALEGVNNSIRYGDISLAKCISKMTNAGADPSEAREKCINGENKSGSGDTSKDEKLNNANTSDPAFDINKFFDRMFPIEANEKDKNGNIVRSVNINDKRYTRISKEKSLALYLFPGIDINGTLVVTHGGTFSPPVESAQEETQNKTKQYIIELVRKLNDRYIKKGMTAKQALRECSKDGVCDWDMSCKSETNCTWDLSKYKKENKEVPSIVLESSDPSSEPTFLITPEQIIALTTILNSHNETIANAKLDLAAERLASSVSYTKTFNLISGIQRKATEACRSPEFNNELAQKSCKDSREKIQDEIVFLKNKSDSEDSALKNQQVVSEMIINSQEENEPDYSVDEQPTTKTIPSAIRRN